MKRLLIIAGICGLLAAVLLGVEIYREAREAMGRAKQDGATRNAFYTFMNQLRARDWKQMHADMAPGFRAAVPEGELAARLQAFLQKHGDQNGFAVTSGAGFKWVGAGLKFSPSQEFKISFQNTKDVPFEFLVESEGDKVRMSRFALRAPTDPLELPAPATVTAGAPR